MRCLGIRSYRNVLSCRLKLRLSQDNNCRVKLLVCCTIVKDGGMIGKCVYT